MQHVLALTLLVTFVRMELLEITNVRVKRVGFGRVERSETGYLERLSVVYVDHICDVDHVTCMISANERAYLAVHFCQSQQMKTTGVELPRQRFCTTRFRLRFHSF